MDELHTVFDITAGPDGIGGDVWFRLAVGLGLTAAGLRWLLRAWRARAGGRRMFNALGLAGFGVAWLVLYLPGWRGPSEVTEGTVHVTHMQSEHGHSDGDKIIVGGKQFEINHFAWTPSYRRTIAYGGALREGVYARLHHYGDTIVKIEVRPDAASR